MSRMALSLVITATPATFVSMTNMPCAHLSGADPFMNNFDHHIIAAPGILDVWCGITYTKARELRASDALHLHIKLRLQSLEQPQNF